MYQNILNFCTAVGMIVILGIFATDCYDRYRWLRSLYLNYVFHMEADRELERMMNRNRVDKVWHGDD